jgi:acetyl esterase
MTVNADIAEFLARLPAAQPASLDDIRTETDRALVALQGPLEAVDRVEDIAADGPTPDVIIPVRGYWPAATRKGEKLPAIVFAHAGGWCLVSLDTYDNPCRALANATGCAVFSVGYRLAPEHPYPLPLEDFYKALCWIVEHADRFAIDATRVVVAGDSAGGNLAAAAALLARDRQGPAIAHQLLIYPALDVDFDTPSYREFADGYYLTRETMKFCWDAYLGQLRTAPPVYATPLRADVSGLPSATIMVSQYDPVRSEGEAYARRLQESGVPATLILLEGMIHACIHMIGVAPHAQILLARAGQEVRRKFALP